MSKPLWIKNAQYFFDSIAFKLAEKKFFFDIEEMTNKRILIVGAADFVPLEIAELDSRDFDVIIKFNGSGVGPALNFKDKSVITYEYLLTNLYSEPTDSQIESYQLQRLIVRVPEKNLIHIFLKLLMRRPNLSKIGRIVKHQHWTQASDEIGGYTPTVGYIATHLALKSTCKSIVVVGFSFYNTGDVAGHLPPEFEPGRIPPEHNPALERKSLNHLLKNDARLSFGPITKEYLTN